WTIADTGDALRWGLVTLAYGAIVVAAGVIALRPRGLTWIAATVCSLAAVSGIVGIVAACTTGEPLADLIRGSWRPGGTLEYSAALALLEVSALPALLSAMCSQRRWLATLGVAGAAIAGGVLGLGIGVAVGAGPPSSSAGRPHHVAHAIAPPSGGLLHGRLHLWHAGLEAFADRPLIGSGADSFILATARYQPRGSLVQFAHD